MQRKKLAIKTMAIQTCLFSPRSSQPIQYNKSYLEDRTGVGKMFDLP